MAHKYTLVNNNEPFFLRGTIKRRPKMAIQGIEHWFWNQNSATGRTTIYILMRQTLAVDRMNYEVQRYIHIIRKIFPLLDLIGNFAWNSPQ